jgi:histidinol-phosphate/aromatic aminotransferase/cobyric acid decarboxylase-like protein
MQQAANNLFRNARKFNLYINQLNPDKKRLIHEIENIKQLVLQIESEANYLK